MMAAAIVESPYEDSVFTSMFYKQLDSPDKEYQGHASSLAMGEK